MEDLKAFNCLTRVSNRGRSNDLNEQVKGKFFKDEEGEVGKEVQQAADTGGAAASPSTGEAVSTTQNFPEIDGPIEIAYVPQTPRGSPTARPHCDGDGDVDIDEHQAKKLRNEDPK